MLVEERQRLAGLLAVTPGFEVTPSRTNFLLCRLSGVEAKEVHARLRARGLMIRYFDTPLLKNHLRISVGTPQQTDQLVAALRDIVSSLASTEVSRAP